MFFWIFFNNWLPKRENNLKEGGEGYFFERVLFVQNFRRITKFYHSDFMASSHKTMTSKNAEIINDVIEMITPNVFILLDSSKVRGQASH